MDESDPSMLVDLDYIEELNGKDDLRDRLSESFEGTIFEEIPSTLYEGGYMDWAEVFSNRKDDIFELDNVIGTKGIDMQSIMNQTEFIRALAEREDTNWYDAIVFLGEFVSMQADIIAEEFDTDEEFIEYYIDELAEGEDEEETIRGVFKEIQDGELDDPINELGMLLLPNNLQGDDVPKIAKMYGIVGGMSKMGVDILDGWDNEPEIGQYLVMTSEDEGMTAKTLVKVIDKEYEPIMASDVLEEEDELDEDFELENDIQLVVETITYEDDVLEIYPEHYLATADPNETNTIESTLEEKMEVYDEKPLHLFD